MFTIDGTTIRLTRGDTFNAQVDIYQGTEPYALQSGDVVRFVAKRCYAEPHPLIEKIIPHSTLILHLAPADTKPLTPGRYVYDIELTFADGNVDTFINGGEFVLAPEVD